VHRCSPRKRSTWRVSGHIYVLKRHELSRSRFFVAALIGTARLRLVEVPSEILEASADDRNLLVKQVIRDHHRAH
jgi:hypothetical protein